MPLRQARPSDARGIAQVHIASWQEAYRGILPDRVLDNLAVEQSASVWEARLNEGAWQVLVFERENSITGFASFGPSRDENADEREVGEIYTVYVDPQQWRNGYGSALAQAAMDALAEQGFSEVALWVLRKNEQAKAFYEAMGFEADGAQKVVTRRDGTELHEARYRRSLEGR